MNINTSGVSLSCAAPFLTLKPIFKRNMKHSQAYLDAMDDVHTRFILNLPVEELASADRIFFQLEQAWWFYDDFICDGAAKEGKEGELKRFKYLKPFAAAMFEFSDLLKPMLPRFEEMYAEFSAYKRSISTYGTILLNRDATQLVLCKNWNGKSWTLPGGKVNQNEGGKEAAARETYEETGFDPNAERGLCSVWKERLEKGEVVDELIGEFDEDKDVDDILPWKPLQDGDKLVYTEDDTKKRRTCYVCRGVPESYPFQPVARKEVSEVAWHDLNSLPKQTYAVLPFLGKLKGWIKRDNRKRFQNCVGDGGEWENEPSGDKLASSRSGSRSRNQSVTPKLRARDGSAPKRRGSSGIVTTPNRSASTSKKDKRDRSRGKNSRTKSRSGSESKEVRDGDGLVESALASPGESNRWTEEEMFATNERLLGRKITYDGNPHDFAEKGFHMVGDNRIDPHAFRVVGGGFMNSGGGAGLSAPPDASALQPLTARVRSISKGSYASSTNNGVDADIDDVGLTPFFSEDGKAPWEETILDTMLPGLSLGGDASTSTGTDASPMTVRSAQATQSNSKGLALLNRLRQGAPANVDDNDNIPLQRVYETEISTHGKEKVTKDAELSINSDDENMDWFLTDREITAKSQQEKLGSMIVGKVISSTPTTSRFEGHHDENWTWMKQWVQNLPKVTPSKTFGDFRFDVDAIMAVMQTKA
mmetsp:Transcript_23953/g.47991  ORF Transcript_23953/g.47991 Transcript_23953/m.47991 type:complete len:703 (-) Transcript_23953:16-2124(-)